MKTIGLMGGMSWESSIEYYRIINQAIRERLGGFHSARSVMVSIDFAEIETAQQAGDWDKAAQIMVEAARNVERGGGEFLVICTNTMHKLAPEVGAQIEIPILHIADATASRIKQRGLKRIGLLGTRFTMEEEFYRGRMMEEHGLDILIPADADRELVHDVIYDELVLGKINEQSKVEYLRIIDGLRETGAEGVILGCTEISLLVADGDLEMPTFDTTRIHAQTAVEFALGDFKDLP